MGKSCLKNEKSKELMMGQGKLIPRRPCTNSVQTFQVKRISNRKKETFFHSQEIGHFFISNYLLKIIYGIPLLITKLKLN